MSVIDIRKTLKGVAVPRSGSEPGAPRAFELPDAPPGLVLRSPTVRPPEPEEWLDPEHRGLPEVIGANDDKLRDVTSNAIAMRLLECLDSRYDVALSSAKKLWLWMGDIFQPMPDAWLDKAFQLYHGAMSEQQKLPDPPPGVGMPWFFTPATLACVRKSLFTELEGRQLAMGGDPFASSPALATFGGSTVLFEKGKRTVRVEPNSHEWRSTFAYPFEWTDEPCEPEWLMRILREDTFAGVEEKERELRIERLRQQMGLAMLGCQAMANLHSVLIMKGHGHDGKSMLLELLRLCMPHDSCLTLNPQDLSSGTGDGAEGRADLHGKFAVVCDDISERAMKDSSHYKTATAYGKIRGRRFGSGVASFEFAPRATWFLACQELWKTDDKTRGFQRRHCIIEFPNSIREEDADRSLARRLYSLERQRIVVWACQAAIALLRGGALAKPECSDRLMREWMAGANPVLSFAQGCCELTQTPENETRVLYDTQYVPWCAFMGMPPVAFHVFGKALVSVPGVVLGKHPQTRRSVTNLAAKG